MLFSSDCVNESYMQRLSNFSEFGKLTRYGLSPFFDPKVSLTFENYVEAQEGSKDKKFQWIVCKINNFKTVIINAKKIAIALDVAPENVCTVLHVDSNVKKIRETYREEMRKLLQSIKEPSSIDDKTVKFAESLFDDETSETQIIEQSFDEKNIVKLVGFRTLESKLRIILFNSTDKIGIGGFSTIMKVVDISKAAFSALKIAKCEHAKTKVCEFVLSQESQAFDVCYGTESKEGSQQTGWEVKPSQIFRFPLTLVEKHSEIITTCLLKPYNDKLDLFDFLEKGKVMNFEAIINGFFQLVIGLARFADQDIFLLDISPSNVWLKSKDKNMFELRLADFSNLNSIKNLRMEVSNNKRRFTARASPFRKYVEDMLLVQYRQKIESKEDIEVNIKLLCALAKKVDVFSLGVCLFMLIHQSLSPPYYLETQLGEKFAGKIDYTIKKEFKFLEPLFQKIFENKEKRISAHDLALEFYTVIKEKFPKLAEPFETELSFLKEVKIS